MVVVYNPATENPYGSRIAAPILSNILNEVLPYIGIASEKSDTTNTTTATPKKSTVIDVTNKTLTEGKKVLEGLGFKVIAPETENANSVLISEQVPGKGAEILSGGTVALYTEENNVRTSVEVPNFVRKDGF